MTTESIRWAKSVGIDVGRRPNFRILVLIDNSGKRPGNFISGQRTWFYIQVEAKFWSVEFGHRRKCFKYVKWHRAPAQIPHRDIELPTPKLATIRTWLAQIESSFGEELRRDIPRIESNVKAADELTTWIASIPTGRVRW